MDSLKINDRFSRNITLIQEVKDKKDRLIRKGKELSGQTDKGQYDYHIAWQSGDGRYKVGVGKYGKEYYLQTISWKDGHKGNNPNDMRPTIWIDGKEAAFDGSFDHVFNFFQYVCHIDTRALEILGCLMFRNAFLLDHDEELNYHPSQEAVDYLKKTVPEYEGISVEAYLHYMEMIAWNEDIKYHSLGYDVHKGIGRKNNMLTYAHIIAILLGKGSLSKLCSQFSRPPVGVSPIAQSLAREVFTDLELE